MMYPSEVVNCRCIALTRARWGLDESELETLKERAAYFGLDKTKNFEDFKQKYLKNADKILENSNNYGRIIPGVTFANSEALNQHYNKHSADFNSIEDYLDRANNLINAELSEDVVQLTRSDNSVSEYRISTNEFVVTNEDGTIRTFFKPENREEYWQFELDRNK